MKTSRRKYLAIGAGVAVLVALGGLFWPEIVFRRALSKYRFGITAEALQREIGIPVTLHKNGNYLADDDSDIEKRHHIS